MIKKRFIKKVNIIISITFSVILFFGCGLVRKFPNLVDKNYLTVGIYKDYEKVYGKTYEMVNNILTSVSDSSSLVLKYVYIDSDDELIRGLDDNKFDVIVGSFIQGDPAINQYEQSFVYDYQNVYCITNLIDYITQIKYLNNDNTYLSKYLSNTMLEKLSIIKNFDNDIRYNYIDGVSKINELFKSEETINYLCYKNIAMSLLKLVQNKNINIYRIVDVDEDGLIMLSNKKNKKIIDEINKVIVDNAY